MSYHTWLIKVGGAGGNKHTGLGSLDPAVFRRLSVGLVTSPVLVHVPSVTMVCVPDVLAFFALSFFLSFSSDVKLAEEKGTLEHKFPKFVCCRDLFLLSNIGELGAVSIIIAQGYIRLSFEGGPFCAVVP